MVRARVLKVLGLIVVLVIVVGMLAACGTPAPTATPTPPPTPTATGPRTTGKVDVGGYRLFFRCTGEGTPTVILESDLASPAILTANQVGGLGMRVCYYERAGSMKGPTAASDPPLKKPRTSQDMANDLHTLLINAQVDGPYILVGQWFGCYNTLVYAGLYPQEVAGMVLIDPSHPDQAARTLALLPPESPNEPSQVQQQRRYFAVWWNDPGLNTEGWDFPASAAQVKAVTSLGDMPLVILASTHVDWGADFPADLSEKLDEEYLAMRKEMCQLSSKCMWITTENKGRYIQGLVGSLNLQPLFDAIQKAVEAARK